VSDRRARTAGLLHLAGVKGVFKRLPLGRYTVYTTPSVASVSGPSMNSLNGKKPVTKLGLQGLFRGDDLGRFRVASVRSGRYLRPFKCRPCSEK
jgi:hypothetical protein